MPTIGWCRLVRICDATIFNTFSIDLIRLCETNYKLLVHDQSQSYPNWIDNCSSPVIWNNYIWYPTRISTEIWQLMQINYYIYNIRFKYILNGNRSCKPVILPFRPWKWDSTEITQNKYIQIDRTRRDFDWVSVTTFIEWEKGICRIYYYVDEGKCHEGDCTWGLTHKL